MTQMPSHVADKLLTRFFKLFTRYSVRTYFIVRWELFLLLFPVNCRKTC